MAACPTISALGVTPKYRPSQEPGVSPSRNTCPSFRDVHTCHEGSGSPDSHHGVASFRS